MSVNHDYIKLLTILELEEKRGLLLVDEMMWKRVVDRFIWLVIRFLGSVLD